MSFELPTRDNASPTEDDVPVESPDDNEQTAVHEEINSNDESKGLLVDEFEDGDVREQYEGVSLVKMDYSHWKRKATMLLAFIALAVGGLLSVETTKKEKLMEDVIPVPSRKKVQVANFVNGTALLLSIHITHHAGTSICRIMKSLGSAPESACNGPGKDGIWPGKFSNQGNKHWSYNNTEKRVERFRPFFSFMSHEYRSFGDLHGTNWEYKNLVSLIVMRDPLGRFLAGGRCGQFHAGHEKDITGDPTNETQALFWEYANAKCADNFALRVLANKKNCVNGAKTSLACLEGAKTLMKRFTFIIDQACLGDSMVALGDKLHLDIKKEDFESRLHHHHPVSIRERLKNDTLYEYLQHRFRRDIELYEWSKNRSIVQCDKIVRY